MLDWPQLPALTKQEVEISAFLMSLPEGVQVALPMADPDGGVLPMPFTLHLATEFGARVLAVDVMLGAAWGRLWLDADWVDAACDVLIPDWRSEASGVLPENWRVSCVLERLLAATPLDLDGLDISDVVEMPASDVDGPFRGTVWIGERAFGFALLMTRANLPLIRQIFAPLPPRRALPFAPDFPARIMLDVVALPLPELRDLSPGDIVLCPGAAPEAVPARVDLGHAGLLKGLLDGAGAFLVTHFQPEVSDMPDLEDLRDESEMREDPRIEDPEMTVEDTEMSGSGIPNLVDRLSVNIDFVLASQRVSLSDLAAWGPGRVVDLGLDLTGPVHVQLNGMHAGHGHLVQIGDRVGIRIERWRHDGEGSDG